MSKTNKTTKTSTTRAYYFGGFGDALKPFESDGVNSIIRYDTAAHARFSAMTDAALDEVRYDYPPQGKRERAALAVAIAERAVRAWRAS